MQTTSINSNVDNKTEQEGDCVMPIHVYSVITIYIYMYKSC
jgi:hypothetical protein